MSNSEEKIAVSNVLGQYAQVLNAANVALIPDFYSEDGLFIPNGKTALYKQSDLKMLSGAFLKDTNFCIEYAFDSVVVDGPYAFVEAYATTSENTGGTVVIKKSTDSFVFKKVQDNWKIFRYTFNNVTVQ